ncbi:hypothetical protein OIU91_16485 [Streptomyces sp. NBC_01456]|uniref:hypothetical protein n=1 Tax=Streptomyces sp. NBC_01456 TaxID=2975868 RepID=UPI002E375C12|nr:hypothetical protein [Streptomyces sp. NBC_01456]
MTYELADAARRKTRANEYRNTKTGEFEIIAKHGLYDVQETFLTPEGQILFIAYNGHASHPHAVGIYNSDHGVYWTDPHDARRHYAWQIAESFGLVVDKEGSKAVVPASREYATDLVKKIKQAHDQWYDLPDDVEAASAGDQVADHAISLAKHLQRTGVLSVPVFDSSEVVG